MDLALQIGTAVLVGAMLLYMWPRARRMADESPKGSGDDWRTFVLILAVVGLFVLLLIKLV